MTEPIRVAHALVRAASAFLSTLGRRPPEAARAKLLGAQRTSISSIPSGLPASSGLPVSSELPSTAGVDNRCPVCQARFRGSRICSRCGADLEPLMLLTVKAWQLRQAARKALDAGDAGRAIGLATEAQGAQNTGSGEALRLLGAWLNSKTGRAASSSSSPR